MRESAEHRPFAQAVVSPEETLTYAELERDSNRLARYLQRCRIGPDIPVGLCVERSPGMLVALLGILKAGGVCVPLDPAYPQERLAWMLADSAAPVLLTHEAFSALRIDGVRPVILDAEREIISREADSPLNLNPDSDHLAYIIYTSGSTGRPKGAMIPHGVLSNLIDWNRSVLPFAARTLQYTSVSFDVSFQEIFLTWATGGTLLLTPEMVRRDPGALSECLDAHGVQRLFLPFVALQRLAEACLARPHLSLVLEDVITAGEQLRVTPEIRAWLDGLPGCRLHNHYGPSETHVLTAHILYGEPTDWPDLPPIGQPIRGVRVHLIDRQLRPVPAGEVGEVYAGGIAPGRGYLGRPALTAEHFLPDPSGENSGGRLYRTGDLARLLPDESYEFLGRADDQVKIRGFRVELGEIEAVLGRHPQLREVAAAAVPDSSGAQRLAAFFVAGEGESPRVAELRQFLVDALPDYMVPSQFVAVARMPLTPSGKLDRRALQMVLPAISPREVSARDADGCDLTLPCTELERLLAAMWCEVLGLARVGAYDDFFALGGDSVRGAIFTNRLQARMGEYVYLVALFEAPTVSGLAAYLEQHYGSAVDRMLGREGKDAPADVSATHACEGKLNEKLAELRRLVAFLPACAGASDVEDRRNPRAVFVLSPPRSGSTLLRVVLGGHPQLFAPPELDLLSFGTLAERTAALSGRHGWRLEGAVRAVMQLRDLDAEAARLLLERLEAGGGTTRDLYRLLQEWAGQRTLVDKSTPYALDMEVLRRAEAEFDQPIYLHLLRHPLGMIRSFEEVRLDRLFLHGNDRFGVREFAELIWLTSHRNLLALEKEVPPGRWLRVRFEDLVERPRETAAVLCRMIGIEFFPGMLEPYQDSRAKMTDGLHTDSASRMVGDVRFHEHASITPAVAHRWKEGRAALLYEETRRVADGLGYNVRAALSPKVGRGPQAEELLARLDELSATEVDTLLAHLLTDEEEIA